MKATSYLSCMPNLLGPAGDRDALHKGIWRQSGMESAADKSPFLFRVDNTNHTILIRSPMKIEWSSPGIPCKQETHAWENGDVVKVVVDLAPMKRSKGKEFALSAKEDLLAFGLAKAKEMGLSPLEDLGAEEEGQPTVYFSPLYVGEIHRDDKIPLKAQKYIILGVVEDAEKFNVAMVRGIGRKRFLGFGMPLALSPDTLI